MSEKTGDVDYYLSQSGLDSEREKEIGQHIGYRYDVNLVPDYERITPFLKRYVETMGWTDLNWLEDVHMGYEEGRPAVSTATSTAGSRCRRTWSCRTISRTATCSPASCW